MSANQTTTGTTAGPTTSGDGTPEEAIRFEGVTKRFGATVAVNDLNLSIRRGRQDQRAGFSACDRNGAGGRA